MTQHAAERRALIEAFFRFDSPDLLTIRRRASLCLLLDIIHQSQGRPLYEHDIRAAMYFWSYGEHHAYHPVGPLLLPAQGWRIFQLRQFFVFALESMWSLFLTWLQDGPLTESAYLGRVLDELGLAELADEVGLALPATDAQRLKLADFYTAVRDALPPGALAPGPTAWRTALNEQRLSDPLWYDSRRREARLGVGHPLLMLALMYWRCQPWREDVGWRYVDDAFAAGRLPISAHLRDVERAWAEGLTVAQWIAWLHRHYLWLQHRRVVLEKLLWRHEETSKFEMVDGDPGQGADGHVRFRGLGLDWPKVNGPRFPSALSIMTDLDLMAPAVGGGYTLRHDGQALLDYFRTQPLSGWDEGHDAEAPEHAQADAG